MRQYHKLGWLIFLLSLPLSATPLTVNVDNPSFRKIVTAVPHFSDQAKSKDSAALAKRGQQRLRDLLEFSRLFNIMRGKVYENAALPLTSFRKLGVEALVQGTLKRGTGKHFNLQMSALDIKRKTTIIAKTYRDVSRANIDTVLRDYGDTVLKTYTRKSGLFFSKITFVGKKTKKSFKQIYTMDFDGGNLKQITNTPAHHLSPAWSPDGRYLVYTSFEDGNPDLFIYDLVHKTHSKLSGREGINSGGHFAHTGDIVAFTGSQRGDADIYVINRQGMSRRRLIKGSGLDVDPAFSPDGKWLAFVSGRYGNPHIFRATLQWSMDRLRVMDDKRLTYAGWYNANPAWSPDSRKIAFAGYDRDIDRFDVFLMNADGSNLERMTLNNGDNESPSWSPNGMLLVFFSTRTLHRKRKGAAQLYIMNRDGSMQRKLFTGLHNAQTPRWSNNVNPNSAQ